MERAPLVWRRSRRHFCWRLVSAQREPINAQKTTVVSPSLDDPRVPQQVFQRKSLGVYRQLLQHFRALVALEELHNGGERAVRGPALQQLQQPPCCLYTRMLLAKSCRPHVGRCSPASKPTRDSARSCSSSSRSSCVCLHACITRLLLGHPPLSQSQQHLQNK